MGFKTILIGFIFFFDLNIDGFDILPDIIGYILVLKGLRVLAPYNKSFEEAIPFTLAAVFVSIFSLFNIYLGFITYVIAFIAGGLFLRIVYGITLGINEEAKKYDMPILAKKADNMFKLNVAVFVIPFILWIPFLGVLLFIPAFVLSICVYIYAFMVLNTAHDQLASLLTESKDFDLTL